MKKYLIILLLFTACKKSVEYVPKPPPIPDCIVMEMERPEIVVTWVALSSTEIKLNWNKKGRTNYTIQQKINDVWVNVGSCQCNFYIATVSGTQLFRVVAGNMISNVVAVTPFNPPPPMPDRVIKINFTAYYFAYWNAFLQDTTLRDAGLVPWQIDSIMSTVRNGLSGFGITFVTDGPAAQTCVVTQSDEWYGPAGGTAYMNSYNTGKECIVFSKLLSYNWQYIAKAIIHELGHTLGLYHTQNLGLEDNWMSYVYYIRQFFYTVMDVFGITVNQPQVINETIN